MELDCRRSGFAHFTSIPIPPASTFYFLADEWNEGKSASNRPAEENSFSITFRAARWWSGLFHPNVIDIERGCTWNFIDFSFSSFALLFFKEKMLSRNAREGIFPTLEAAVRNNSRRSKKKKVISLHHDSRVCGMFRRCSTTVKNAIFVSACQEGTNQLKRRLIKPFPHCHR